MSNIRVVVGLTSPGDPLKGRGPRLIPGVYPEDDIRRWLNCEGRLSEANFEFALSQGWITKES
jgi:hypothetical protein